VFRIFRLSQTGEGYLDLGLFVREHHQQVDAAINTYPDIVRIEQNAPRPGALVRGGPFLRSP
jgi:hypothetical protein